MAALDGSMKNKREQSFKEDLVYPPLTGEKSVDES